MKISYVWKNWEYMRDQDEQLDGEKIGISANEKMKWE